MRATKIREAVDRRWQVSGAPDLTDYRGRAFRPTEVEVIVIDGAISTTTVHGILLGTNGPYGGRYTDARWYGPWEWQVPPLPEWIRDVAADVQAAG
ncbi:hypothetical protein ACGFI4_04040 [Micromonospora carbonacea]|uniref:hypothetical protein n=1 Tax=Micromonospora carbonacea TaxID=47853 RepID=UPI0037102D4E